MEEKTDIVVDQEKVKRLIIKILLDERKNLREKFSQQKSDGNMAKIIYQDIIREVPKE